MSNKPKIYQTTKRVVDVLLSFSGLVATAPVLAMLALAVRLDSSGPAFFSQERVGRNGRSFKILKLRTMRDGSKGSILTRRDDPRITKTGKMLRRFKLDELPQLWNVLKGDMSLVGPRPETRAFVERYPDSYAEILSFRPGITNPAALALIDEEALLAQVDEVERFYAEAVLPIKLELYREYLQRAGLIYDFSLVLKTMKTIVIRPIRAENSLELEADILSRWQRIKGKE